MFIDRTDAKNANVPVNKVVFMDSLNLYWDYSEKNFSF